MIVTEVRNGLDGYMRNGLAESTYRSYKAAIHAWTRFIEVFGYRWICTHGGRLLEFASFSFNYLRKTWTTVQSYIRAICSVHISMRAPIPHIRWTEIRRVLNAFAKERPNPTRRHIALDSIYLQKMLDTVPPTSYDACVIRAIITVAQNACLRVSEYTVGHSRLVNLTTKELRHLIRWSDFSELNTMDNGAYGTIGFNKSKTNWNENPEFANLPCRCPHPCGHCELKRLRKIAFARFGARTSMPIFQWSDRSLVSRSQVYTLIKKLAVAIGLDPKLVGTHSCRKGGIVDAILDGATDAVLLNLGRWKSFESIRHYIFMEQVQLATARQRLANPASATSHGCPVRAHSLSVLGQTVTHNPYPAPASDASVTAQADQSDSDIDMLPASVNDLSNASDSVYNPDTDMTS